MKTKILVAALATGMVASPVMAADAEVSFSGQVSNVIAFGSDFDESFNIAQNNASGSRFRFRASKKWGNIKVGLRHEIQNRKGSDGSNDTGGVTVVEGGPNLANDGNGQDDLRFSDIYFSGNFGKISFGQATGAADGVSESYAATTGNYFGGTDGFWFAVGTSGISGGDALGFNNLDFLGRNQRLRYDSPKIGGLQVSGSIRSEDGEEIALRYKGKFGGTTLNIQAAHSSTDGGDRTGVAGGVILPFGLTLSGRYVESEGEQETNLFAVGYRAGKFRTSIEAGTSTAFDGTETDFTTIGVTYAGPILLFASYGEFERGEEEFSAPIVGARLSF